MFNHSWQLTTNPVVANIRERLAMNKQRSQKFHMERLNLKKLNKAEGKEKYYIEVPNRFAALKYLDAKADINGAWETIGENIQISAKEPRLL
jgi:hypothetical protein